MTKKIIIQKDYGSYVEGFLFDSASCGNHGSSCVHCSQKKGRPVKALKKRIEEWEPGNQVTIISGKRELFFSLLFMLFLPLAIGFGLFWGFSSLAGLAGAAVSITVIVALGPLLGRFTWPRVK